MNMKTISKSLLCIMFANVLIANDLMESSIPKIPQATLDKIMYSTLIKNEPIVIKEIEKNTTEKKKNHTVDKKRYLLKDILANFEQKFYTLNNPISTLFVAKDKDLALYFKNNEIKELNLIDNIEELISFINKYNGSNLSTKIIQLNQLERIVYVGIYWDRHYEDAKNTIRVSLEPKNIGETIYGDSLESKAFFYFKNYNQIADKDVYFDLSAIEILNLYERLIHWNIDLSGTNKILALMFLNKSKEIKNFNYRLAYQSLLESPTIDLISELKENLEEKNLRVFANNTAFSVKNEDSFESILGHFPKGNSYMISVLPNYENLVLMINKEQNVDNFQQLEDFIFYDKETYKQYKLKVLSNKYINANNKDFTFYTVKTDNQKAIHYLSNALESAKEITNDDFSFELFKEDINEIKKGLL